MTDAKVQINFSIFESFMGNCYKYTVAGHTFCISLPEGFDSQAYLAPYMPFAEEDAQAVPVISLRVEIVESLREIPAGEVKEIFNDESPYFWLFESEGKYSYGFSYTRKSPNCILTVSDDYSDAVARGSIRYVCHSSWLVQDLLSYGVLRGLLLGCLQGL